MAAISVLRSARGSFRSSFVQAASADFCCHFRSHLAHTGASLTTSLMHVHVPYPRVAHTRTLPTRRSYTYLTHASFIHKHVSHPHVAQKCTYTTSTRRSYVFPSLTHAPRPNVAHTRARPYMYSTRHCSSKLKILKCHFHAHYMTNAVHCLSRPHFA